MRLGAFVVATAAFAGSMTGVAWAPKNLFGFGMTAGCATRDGGGLFQGSVNLTGFTTQDGKLMALGTITGTCIPDADSTKFVQLRDQAVLVPVAVSLATCDALDLTLGIVQVPSLGVTVDLTGKHLVAAPATKAERGRFCAAANLLGARPAEEVAIPLTNLIFR